MKFQLVKTARIIRDAIIVLLLFAVVTYFLPAAYYLSLGLVLLCLVKILYRATNGSIAFTDKEVQIVVTNILGRTTSKSCAIAGATYKTGIIKYFFGKKQAQYLEIFNADKKKMMMVVANDTTLSPEDIDRIADYLKANGIKPGGALIKD
ncbi:hypothetical protein ACE38W_03665 [Chitinophaga sp. Hz27]|uniref:hypothetical protein n=1 Tax=Chitinophaga sp. Hz27 TaxID=3347169 RepID=UPI0035DFD493